MKIDVYSSTGTKTGTRELPPELFGARVNNDLMHQAVIMQQSNRRNAVAHVKTRAEVRGSTKKAYDQKHTGRARRGSLRSPLLRGGGKAFGPRNNANFIKDMPKSMRHAALVSCLSAQAKNGVMLGLESYPDAIKTKAFYQLLSKLPVQIGRRILFVVPDQHNALWMSSRNVTRVKILRTAYLNPEDVLLARSIIFVGDAVEKAVSVFGRKESKETREIKETKENGSVKTSKKRSTSSPSRLTKP